MMHRAGTLCLLGLVLAAAAAGRAAVRTAVAEDGAATTRLPIERFELANGMRFLLVRRPELTTVAAGWVARVGSANEHPGITGMAHLFEHMMFKGTRTIGTADAARDAAILGEQEALQEEVRALYRGNRERWRRGEIADPYAPEARPPELVELERRFADLVAEQRALMVKDEFDRIYSSAGASFLNATTNNDSTIYMITVPANKLELWFWMESDRLREPVFREFYSERDVVHEERRMRTESTPTGLFDEQVEAMFWTAHPYGWPVVGWPSDLRVISKAQADEFFATHYAPNNLTAVLVGNLEPAAVRALAERYFGRIPRGSTSPADVVTLEIEQLAEKRLEGECDCAPQVQIAYHTVPFGHRDSYPLEVLAEILNGRTGRLYRGLVEGRQIATDAEAEQRSLKFAGSFTVYAEAKGESGPAALAAAWDDTLAGLAAELVSEAELGKVKNRIAADIYRRLENPFFLMLQLAYYDGLGDSGYLETLEARTRAVTAADVQRVLAAYFKRENRLVASYTRRAGVPAAGTVN